MRKSSLAHHMISHNHMSADQSMASNTSYESCGKTFGVRQKYTMHAEMVHKNTIVCSFSFCGKGFSDRGNHTQQLRTQIGNSPTAEVCKTIFRSQIALKRHMNKVHASRQNIHSGYSFI